jgi:hypothetical protein
MESEICMFALCSTFSKPIFTFYEYQYKIFLYDELFFRNSIEFDYSSMQICGYTERNYMKFHSLNVRLFLIVINISFNQNSMSIFRCITCGQKEDTFLRPFFMLFIKRTIRNTGHILLFLHSSDTEEKMGVQWDSTSAIHRLQESLWFS